MKRRFFKSQLGQTSTEYLLLIAVSIGLGLAVFKRLDEYLIKDPNGFIGKPLKEFQNKLNQDASGRYRVYPIGPMMK